jgi:PilZ domain
MLNKTDTRTLDKRNTKRTKMVVALRVPQERSAVADLLVHTLDISSSGAKIGALREWMEPGSALTVQRKHTRARCLVMWSRKVAPGEIQIGIRFLERDSHFWGLDLDEECAGVWFSESER